MAQSTDLPDGITEDHAAETRGLRAHASPLAFALLAGLVVVAMTGVLGGSPAPVSVTVAPAALLEVKAARPLRGGLFFETRIRIVARRAIAKPVLGIDAMLWRDLTINSHIPAASEEEFVDGQFRFTYPALKAGDVLEVKIDGQTNPPLVGRVEGAITLLDDHRHLAKTRLSIPVLP